MNNPEYDRWFATLSAAQQAKANELLSRFRALNADDPESWVQSEISEDIPQLARFLVLRRIWPEYIDSWTRDPVRWVTQSVSGAGEDPQDAGAALKRMMERGVSPADIASVARMVAYETVFAVLDHIDEGYDPDAPEDAPGWLLMETRTDGRTTGRHLRGLHESIFEMDPSGRDGQPE
jgi:hypothetical protein